MAIRSCADTGRTDADARSRNPRLQGTVSVARTAGAERGVAPEARVGQHPGSHGERLAVGSQQRGAVLVGARPTPTPRNGMVTVYGSPVSGLDRIAPSYGG